MDKKHSNFEKSHKGRMGPRGSSPTLPPHRQKMTGSIPEGKRKISPTTYHSVDCLKKKKS